MSETINSEICRIMECVMKDCDYISKLKECDMYMIQRLALIHTLAENVKRHLS